MSRVDEMLASPADDIPAEISRLYSESLDEIELLELTEKIGAGVPETDKIVGNRLVKLIKDYDSYSLTGTLARSGSQIVAVGILAGADIGTSLLDSETGKRKGKKRKKRPKVGVKKVAGAVVRATADRLADYVVSEVDEWVVSRNKALVATHLEAMREEVNYSREQMDGLSQEEVRQIAIKTKQRIIDGERFKFLPPEEREYAILQSTRMLEDQLSRGIALNAIAARENADNIEEMRQGLDAIRKRQAATETAFRGMEQNLEKVQASLSEFKTSVENLRDQTDLNTGDIAVLQEVVFSEADLSGKIAMLERGAIALPEPQRAKEIAKYKAVQAREQLKADIDECLENGRHVLTIADNLGIALPKEVNDLANIAQVGMTAYSAYLSGNPLAAASAVSSLFGGGSSGDQAAAQRHAEIMNKLKMMDEKLDKLLEGQKKIMRGIVEILDVLQELSDQIAELHGREMDQLHRNLGATLYNRIVIEELHNREIYMFLGLATRVREEQDEAGWLSLAQLRKIYEDHGHEFDDAKTALRGVLNAAAGIDPFLRLQVREGESYSDDIDVPNQITIVLKGFRSALAYREQLSHGEQRHSHFDLPAVSVEHLIGREARSSNAAHDFDEQSLGEFISTAHLEEVALAMVDLHQLYLLQVGRESEDRLYDLDSFFTLSSYTTEGRVRLEEAADLVHIAIAQESLLSGDFLLARIYDDLIVADSQAAADRKELALAALRDNALLQLNFSNYLLYRQLQTPRSLPSGSEARRFPFEYFPFLADRSDLSGASPDIAGVRSFFDSHLHERIVLHQFASVNGKRWALRLGVGDDAVFVQLPDRDTYDNGALVYRPDMYRLHALQEHLQDALSSFRLTELANEPALIQRLRFVS